MKSIMNPHIYKKQINAPTPDTKDTCSLIDHKYVTNEGNFFTVTVISLSISDRHLTYVFYEN